MDTNPRVLYLITRIGGWDGISIQSKLWIKLLLSLRKKVTIATGKIEEMAGPMDVYPFSRTRNVVIRDMSLGAQSWLFKNSFRGKYERRKWLKRFLKAKNSIKAKLGKLCDENDIIIAHNFSIKHLVPAAWAAVYELASENPDKKFISIDADSPYERGFVISDVNPEVLWIIGNPDLWMGKDIDEIDKSLTSVRGKKLQVLPGPVPLPNIFHVSFNNYQSRVIREIYGINPDNLTVIPDMGEFTGPRPWRRIASGPVLRMISSCQIVNPRTSVTKDDVFILSPVRPIYRKNLKYIAFLADQFRLYLSENGKKRNVFLVITHPTDKAVDNESYWKELKKEVASLDITLVHLGEKLLLRRKKGRKGILYTEFMWAISKLNSASIIGSTSGAWENGIVESTEAKLPVSVNPLLPPYQDMVMMGLQYIPCPITRASIMLKRGLGNLVWMNDASIEKFFESLHDMIFDKKKRKRIVENNFSIGKKNLSINTVRPVIKRIIG